MIPLYILLGVFAASLLIRKLITKKYNFSLAGRIAMSAMLLTTAIGHFIYPEGMALMIPDFIPSKKELVFFTGFIEIAAAIGLLIPRLQRLTAWLLILFFILVLPANINAAVNNVDYQTGENTGHGVDYLWFRIPLQIFFILWTYFFAVKWKNI